MATVAVLGGTGALGFGLVLRFAAAGYQVAIGSRDADRAKAAAERATELVPEAWVHGMSYADAAADATRLVVLTVPFASQAETLKAVSGSLREGMVVLDTTVPLAPAVGGRPTQLVGVWQGSAAQQAAALVPAGVRVVSALHTISAAALTDLGHEVDEDTFLAGAAEAKKVVADHLQVVPGLRAIDAGPLEASRLTESITPLLIGLNMRYKTHTGVRITGLEAIA
ncbi:NADPH-dependent F420 reductase [Nocardioides marmoriginsengisoli]|uniref:NADPH-dependent F420 reductase n=1 Tax=Nocardioides marmoriginsengisoli TaxID=661483 RepID=A0A3N0CBI9_9ACTN|nr:NADPH-dependent F420 reductase [Nocardioides marmoriginsengisoli]RNL60815.1 NADPH-dependent F420 reductase [Nocardioides marmoriginsengisoli]